mmetsp:Transcript_6219/g.20304  ORF Transcript_6219/g.20304 Transcript_6219/m.20304 type:complete len:229 (-) Transcript_6219:650-1336(-)
MLPRSLLTRRCSTPLRGPLAFPRMNALPGCPSCSARPCPWFPLAFPCRCTLTHTVHLRPTTALSSWRRTATLTFSALCTCTRRGALGGPSPPTVCRTACACPPCSSARARGWLRRHLTKAALPSHAPSRSATRASTRGVPTASSTSSGTSCRRGTRGQADRRGSASSYRPRCGRRTWGRRRRVPRCTPRSTTSTPSTWTTSCYTGPAAWSTSGCSRASLKERGRTRGW